MIRRTWMLSAAACVACWAAAAWAAQPGPTRLPGPELNLTLAAPIATWDEAVPLGNGLMGGLLWGGESTLKLSLDRGDLWDERPADGMRWELFTYANLITKVGERDAKYIADVFDRAYRDSHPSKIPAGRIEIDLDLGQRLESFDLNLATAEGRAQFEGGARAEAFFSATQPVAFLRVPGAQPRAARLLTPGMVAGAGATAAGPDSQGVAKLGYPPAAFGEEPGLQWYVQEAALGMRYVVALGSRRVGDSTLYAVAVTATMDGPDPLALAKRHVLEALEAGWDASRAPHAAWWAGFWSQSKVSVPDVAILRQYYLVRYFYGAASRRGAPPMPLQGVWTADAGSLPPWKGDYHNDLNTQMTYMAYQAAGHFDEGLTYLDFLWDRRPRFQRFAREFYGTGGLATPGVMTLAGEPLAGWVQYSLSPTMSAWSAHLFYLHWRYTMDETFLRERAYPWASDVGTCMLALLKPDAKGVLVLPLSSSPEVFDNSPRAWMEPNSNYDLMSLRMLFLSLTEMADALGRHEEAARWRQASDRLGPYHVRADGTLKLSANEDLPASHRHLSNLMGLHPFNLITAESGSGDARMIRASLADWDAMGTRQWCGYSFSWMSALRARVGQAEEALRLLEIYAKAFVLRNGFHANGDQTKSGYSNYTYRPFTLEGNFLAMHAVHEMLLQSWSATPGVRDTGVIRLFPATSARWQDASFEDLRAEGGYLVSARREGGVTTWFRVKATRTGVLRIRDSFGGRAPSWNRSGVRNAGQNFEVPVKAGDIVEARFTSPAGTALEGGSDAPAGQADPDHADPAPARDDGRRTIGRFGSNLARGTAGILSTDNIRPLLVGSAATGIGSIFDNELADAIANPSNGFGKSFESGASPAVIGGVVAVLFATGRAVDAPRYRAMTYDWVHAVLITGGYTVLIKEVVRRDRPNGEDHLSFPSGHASNAFAIAAVAERHYGWKAGAPAYALASAVAVSRLQRNAHYLSDVLAGATLGYIVGRTVVRVNSQPIGPSRGPRLALSPVLTRHSRALVAGVTF